MGRFRKSQRTLPVATYSESRAAEVSTVNFRHQGHWKSDISTTRIGAVGLPLLRARTRSGSGALGVGGATGRWAAAPLAAARVRRRRTARRRIGLDPGAPLEIGRASCR